VSLTEKKGPTGRRGGTHSPTSQRLKESKYPRRGGGRCALPPAENQEAFALGPTQFRKRLEKNSWDVAKPPYEGRHHPVTGLHRQQRGMN